MVAPNELRDLLTAAADGYFNLEEMEGLEALLASHHLVVLHNSFRKNELGRTVRQLHLVPSGMAGLALLEYINEYSRRLSDEVPTLGLSQAWLTNSEAEALCAVVVEQSAPELPLTVLMLLEHHTADSLTRAGAVDAHAALLFEKIAVDIARLSGPQLKKIPDLWRIAPHPLACEANGWTISLPALWVPIGDVPEAVCPSHPTRYRGERPSPYAALVEEAAARAADAVAPDEPMREKRAPNAGVSDAKLTGRRQECAKLIRDASKKRSQTELLASKSFKRKEAAARAALFREDPDLEQQEAEAERLRQELLAEELEEEAQEKKKNDKAKKRKEQKEAKKDLKAKEEALLKEQKEKLVAVADALKKTQSSQQSARAKIAAEMAHARDDLSARAAESWRKALGAEERRVRAEVAKSEQQARSAAGWAEEKALLESIIAETAARGVVVAAADAAWARVVKAAHVAGDSSVVEREAWRTRLAGIEDGESRIWARWGPVPVLGIAGVRLEAGVPAVVREAHAGNHTLVAKMVAADPKACTARAPFKGAAHTALTVAALRGHGKTVNALLQAGADRGATIDGTGETALVCAAAHGHTHVIDLLLRADGRKRPPANSDKDSSAAYIAATSAKGFAAVHYAAWGGHVAAVRALLAAGGDAFAAGGVGRWTPLMLAADQGHVEVVEVLVAADSGGSGGEVSPNRGGEKKAAATGIAGVAHPPLQLEAQSREGWTALICAAHRGHLATARALVAAGASPHTTTFCEEPALYIATRMGNAGMVAYLMSIGASCNGVTFDGRTLLGCAIRGAALSVVEALCAGDVDVNQKEGGTPLLCLAAQAVRVEMVELLLAKGAAPWATDAAGTSAFHHAVRTSHVATARVFTQAVPASELNTADPQQGTLLQVATRRGPVAMVKLLITHGAELNYVAANGRTALYVAAEAQQHRIVEYLLASGALVSAGQLKDFAARVGGWRTAAAAAAMRRFEDPIIGAVSGGSGGASYDIVRLLVQHGADIDAVDRRGWCAVLHAASENKIDLYQYLRDCGADITRLKESLETVHAAARKGAKGGAFTKAPAVPLAKYQRNLRNGDVPTPARLRAARGDLLALAKKRAEFEAAQAAKAAAGGHGGARAADGKRKASATAAAKPRMLRDTRGSTMLHLAARDGRADVLATLLKGAGEDVDDKSGDGHTALALAATHGRAECCRALLAHGAQVQVVPLLEVVTAAVSENALTDTLDVLLQAGAAVRGQRDVVHAALAAGRSEVFVRVVRAGADVLAVDASTGVTPLIAAAKMGIGYVRPLLEREEVKNGGVDGTDGELRTALSHACEAGDEEVVDALLAAGADAGLMDGGKQLPLAYAYRAGHGQLAKRVLEEMQLSEEDQALVMAEVRRGHVAAEAQSSAASSPRTSSGPGSSTSVPMQATDGGLDLVFDGSGAVATPTTAPSPPPPPPPADAPGGDLSFADALAGIRVEDAAWAAGYVDPTAVGGGPAATGNSAPLRQLLQYHKTFEYIDADGLDDLERRVHGHNRGSGREVFRTQFARLRAQQRAYAQSQAARLRMLAAYLAAAERRGREAHPQPQAAWAAAVEPQDNPWSAKQRPDPPHDDRENGIARSALLHSLAGVEAASELDVMAALHEAGFKIH